MDFIHHPILTINGGSSGIKFSLYKSGEGLRLLFSGELKFSSKQHTFLFIDALTLEEVKQDIEFSDQENIAEILIRELSKQNVFHEVKAIGHRIVYGMKYTETQIISSKLLNDLKRISAYDPEHLPHQLKLIEAFALQFPDIPQVACFDTAFHNEMPAVAKLLPVPRWLSKKGIQRYGFHGLSYAYLLEELENIAGKETSDGKIIFAHLGSGASLAAVKDGKSVDTSMGFTPASGIPMSTRSGDIEPGIAWYLMQFEKLSPEQFNHLINHESGLLGISETSGDMHELLKIKNTDSRAAEAIELFCYETKKKIGSFAAVLGGIQTLVFSGGIGYHSHQVRSRICDGLQFLGIELDETKNINNDAVISADTSMVCVRVMKTNEELMIAKMLYRLLYKNENEII